MLKKSLHDAFDESIGGFAAGIQFRRSSQALLSAEREFRWASAPLAMVEPTPLIPSSARTVPERFRRLPVWSMKNRIRPTTTSEKERV